MLINSRTTPSEIIDELMLVDRCETAEMVFVYGVITWVKAGYYDVELLKANKTKTVRFLSSSVSYQQDSNNTALIKIPKNLVIPFEISQFVLDDEAVQRRLRHVAEFNSPKLNRTVEKQPERIGKIRI